MDKMKAIKEEGDEIK